MGIDAWIERPGDLFGIGRSDFVTLGWTPCKVRGLSLVGHRLLQLFAAGGPGARGL